MADQVQLRRVESTPTAVICLRVSARELARVVPACCGEVWQFARQANLPNPGRHVAIYLNGAIDLECGVEVTAPFAGNERVVPSVTPAGLAITAAHVGSYADLGVTHRAIRRWAAEHGHPLSGPNWEVYGHWVDDPARLRTDIYYLVSPVIAGHA